MKVSIRKCISGMLCFTMICMSFMQITYAKPVKNELPSPEYNITYRSTGENDTGFTAQFTIRNNTEQAMTDWSFDIDYNEVIEQTDSAAVTVTDGNQHYKKHTDSDGDDILYQLRYGNDSCGKVRMNGKYKSFIVNVEDDIPFSGSLK